ncbi:hypothetical protein N9B63_07110, partial [Akkermansiaceae bacterium]|nr:hypothetical protein [Akkermansiaceae bacterium]
MSTPIEVRSLDRLPKDGCLIVPGRLDAHQANQLAASLSGRTITWLVEETGTLTEDLQSYLQLSGLQGAAFSKNDESLPDVGKNLEPKIAGKGVLIFVPGVTNSRPGTSCCIPSEI